MLKLLHHHLTLKANKLFYKEHSIRKIIPSANHAYFLVPKSKHFEEFQLNQANDEEESIA